MINESTIPCNLVQPKDFQLIIDGKSTDLYYLKNKNNVMAAITNYGGRWVSMIVPDSSGKMVDIVLGFNNLQAYIEADEPYYGATIGRYGNRIANGKFTLDEQTYLLDVNNGPNTLHGGKGGFHEKVWDASQTDSSTLELTYFSINGEGGFPGSLNVKVVYTLTDNDVLKIDYTAVTDQKTIVNLTNHAFFNLNGEGSDSITDHILMLDAKMYTPVNNTLIPLGKIECVKNTPLDFNIPTQIGKRINDKHEQIAHGSGYDHNFVLNRKNAGISLAGTVLGPKTGIVMEVFTEEPAVQFYSGNFLNGKDKGKSGKYYGYRTAFCLETQHFPDSPNQSEFPLTELKPGEIYKSSSEYKFSVKK